jgi:hypothetical protein
MTEFVVAIAYDSCVAFLKPKGNNAEFTIELENTNTYSSRYAAKKHLRTLDNVPEDVKIVELSECSAVW